MRQSTGDYKEEAGSQLEVFIMDFCKQISKLSSYFINNLLFLFPVTTFENVMAKSFEGLKSVWDPAPQSNVGSFLFL